MDLRGEAFLTSSVLYMRHRNYDVNYEARRRFRLRASYLHHDTLI